MSCGCGCCGDSSSGDPTTIVVTNCCGQPDPGSEGTDFSAVLTSSDATSGAQLTLYPMGTVAGALTPPTGTQRLYIFSYQVLVGVAGEFRLYEGIDGDSSFPGDYAKIAAGSLAQNGGVLHRLPNRYLRLGNTLHASHTAVGQLDVIIHGKLVTETA